MKLEPLDAIERMRSRVAQGWRLASQTSDDSMAEALRQIATEGEADIVRRQAEISERAPEIRKLNP